MDVDINWISILLYKTGLVYAGFLIVYLGYKLFLNGVYGKAGDLVANWNDYKIVLKRAAPGTFFVIFGSIFMMYVVFSKIEYKGQSNNSITSTVIDAINSSELNEDTKDSLVYHMNMVLKKHKSNKSTKQKIEGVINNNQPEEQSEQSY
jgi:hypothetical protein